MTNSLKRQLALINRDNFLNRKNLILHALTFAVFHYNALSFNLYIYLTLNFDLDGNINLPFVPVSFRDGNSHFVIHILS